MLGLGEAAYFGRGEQGLSSKGRRTGSSMNPAPAERCCVCARTTFILVGASPSCVVEDCEVGGRNGVWPAAAVAVVTAQTAPRRGLRVDAASAAAALRRHGWGCAVSIWDVLGLKHKKKSQQNQRKRQPASYRLYETHNDGLFLLGGVSDDYALNLLVEALNAVPETRSR